MWIRRASEAVAAHIAGDPAQGGPSPTGARRRLMSETDARPVCYPPNRQCRSSQPPRERSPALPFLRQPSVTVGARGP